MINLYKTTFLFLLATFIVAGTSVPGTQISFNNAHAISAEKAAAKAAKKEAAAIAKAQRQAEKAAKKAEKLAAKQAKKAARLAEKKARQQAKIAAKAAKKAARIAAKQAKAAERAAKKAARIAAKKIKNIIPTPIPVPEPTPIPVVGSNGGGSVINTVSLPKPLFNINNRSIEKSVKDVAVSRTFSVEDLASLAPAAGGKEVKTTAETSTIDIYEEFGEGLLVVEVPSGQETAYNDDGSPKITIIKVNGSIARNLRKLKNGDVLLGS